MKNEKIFKNTVLEIYRNPIVLVDKENYKNSTLAYNTKQASKIICMRESHLRKLRQEGGGPKYCKVGRKVLYRIKDLEEFMKKCIEDLEEILGVIYVD